MSLGRWKQWAYEKAGSVQGTQLESDFADLGRRTDTISDVVKNLTAATEVLLQPSSSTRAKLVSQHTGKSSGQTPYAQPEGALADTMMKSSALYGQTPFGQALQILGDAEKQIADSRFALDTEVMQAVVKPLLDFREHDIKDVQAQRKRLESRRLDYDVKKRQRAKKPDDNKSETDYLDAELKFEQAKETTWNAMAKLMEYEPEQCQQLVVLANAQLEFYRAAIAALEPVIGELKAKCEEASQQPAVPKYEAKASGGLSRVSTSDSQASAAAAVGGGQFVKALFDFNAENEHEISFKKDDKIEVLQILDENWIEGTVNNKTGIFPRSYVEPSS